MQSGILEIFNNDAYWKILNRKLIFYNNKPITYMLYCSRLISPDLFGLIMSL